LPLAKSCVVVVFAATCGAGATTHLSAHRFDELLQAARVSIEADRVDVELDVTPGVSTADSFIRALDTSGDGVVSQREAWGGATTLVHALDVRVDGRPLHAELITVDTPDVASLRSGEGTMVVRAQAKVSTLAAGPHRIVFRNGNDMPGSVFMANVLVPSDRLAVNAQTHTADQRELTVDVSVVAWPARSPLWTWPALILLTATLSLAYTTGIGWPGLGRLQRMS
jgi:hypothetical protein